MSLTQLRDALSMCSPLIIITVDTVAVYSSHAFSSHIHTSVTLPIVSMRFKPGYVGTARVAGFKPPCAGDGVFDSEMVSADFCGFSSEQ